MADANLGGNEFTFAGDRTEITFYPVAPGQVSPEAVVRPWVASSDRRGWLFSPSGQP